MKAIFSILIAVFALGIMACSDVATTPTGESSQVEKSSEALSSKTKSSTSLHSSGSSSSANGKTSSMVSQSADSKFWNTRISYGKLLDDRDEQTYRTVKIGTQTWMAENLKYKPEFGGVNVCYDQKQENCDTYGLLYDWRSAPEVCPEGWRLPDTTDWSLLVKFVGGLEAGGTKLKAKTNFWVFNQGVDTYGFSAIPSGIFDGDLFFDIGITGVWWTTSWKSKNEAYVYDMLGNSSGIRRSALPMATAVSVRCIQGAMVYSSTAESSSAMTSSSMASSSTYVPEFGSFVDSRDNRVYKTVIIGEQTWMAQNLNFSMSGSHCNGGLPESCLAFGLLYDWDMANTACPPDWHLPSNEEWKTLIEFRGGTTNNQGAKLKLSGNPWQEGAGTDLYGFGAEPGGNEVDNEGGGIGSFGYWWTSSLESSTPIYRVMYRNNSRVDSFNTPGDTLFSVRCIKGSL